MVQDFSCLNFEVTPPRVFMVPQAYYAHQRQGCYKLKIRRAVPTLAEARVLCLSIADSIKFYDFDGAGSDVAQRNRRQMEVRFFKQTVYQNALFLYKGISLYCISQLFDNKWAIFFTHTFPLEFCHALDGFIVVLFHFRLSLIGIKSAPTGTQTVVVINSRS
ncbi:hypothetical protein KIN20_030927 [Parelaphostrongylus tenuis]|uniref:7TM GPCR serpentine receptor class x (Srx) domain-containing protein n=1 Tax=Parelaphostrongylus tenuis TaxID=148309 RepID=A0AAD5WH87_PARTN|nr:hypothetical protein KIN20_030927 [Parelaphostrongylus tenuis]